MEVAGQWRRQWAGTAEYGKVTEGGVTRQVARAMEVLQASGPGARVRVMRAAYHSSAGPGAPSASYLVHSSRRVISSGFNLLEPPSFTTKPLEICSKPLEISSTPLESSPESNTEGEDYKVTEPDDFDISEPSKWKSSSGGTLRMPSEESSSTDNASIIDLDSRNSHRSAFRKHSFDSENSDFPSISSRRNSSRASPLLDAPVALSTLKYKSLLNGSNEWNNRRKSYSFEDTSPLNDTIVHTNDTLAMESSTDSGICKSTEIVNDTDKYNDQKERRQDDTFQDWLAKNRSATSFFKNSQFKSYREHNVVLEDPQECNIALQSPGKVSITVPMTIEGDEDYPYKKSSASDDGDRRVKRVEFCKTELHFAAESGKVNIIATDEKPPPSNDFRKRRSAFVPISGNFEKPITLFGETNKDLSAVGTGEFSTCARSEISESDENTAATKSILKNKIPKPKPYLLGENMLFGRSSDLLEKKDHTNFEFAEPTAVPLINRQLQSERTYSNETTSSHSSETDTGVIKNSAFRTVNKGLTINDTLKLRKKVFEPERKDVQIKETAAGSVKNKLKILQMSPIQGRAKTRQLRDSDLTYFGVRSSHKNSDDEHPKYERTLRSENNRFEDTFRSVKLIQQVSNSVCNSEAESEDSPDYQNLPIKSNFAPVPTPRTGVRLLKPVIEQDSETDVSRAETRRSRVRRHEESIAPSSRSISEPPKTSRYNSIEQLHRRQQHLRKHVRADDSPSPSPRTRIDSSEDEITNIGANKQSAIVKSNRTDIISEESEPMYANFDIANRRNQTSLPRNDSTRRSTEQRRSHIKPENNSNRSQRKMETIRSDTNHSFSERQERKENLKENRTGTDKDKDSLKKKQSSIKKKQRTEKLATPDYSNENKRTASDKSSARRTNMLTTEKNDDHNTKEKLKTDHRSRSTHRHSKSTKPVTVDLVTKDLNKTVKEDSKPTTLEKTILENGGTNYHTRTSSKDKTSARKESPKGRQKVITNSIDSHRKPSNSRVKEIIIPERVPNGNSDSHRSKRSEYVINYDDKNGTVSSICKLAGAGSSKMKKILKDGPKEYKERNKATEKITLLQFPDQQTNPNGLSYEDRKRKKTHVQRSCQLL